MLASKRLCDLHFRLHETSRTVRGHCAAFRRTIGENRELVGRSIEAMLDSKAALRSADELLGNKPARWDGAFSVETVWRARPAHDGKTNYDFDGGETEG